MASMDWFGGDNAAGLMQGGQWHAHNYVGMSKRFHVEDLHVAGRGDRE